MSHRLQASRKKSLYINKSTSSSLCLLVSFLLCLCALPVSESCLFGGWWGGDHDYWGDGDHDGYGGYGGWGNGWGGHHNNWNNWGWGGGHRNNYYGGWGGGGHHYNSYGGYNSHPAIYNGHPNSFGYNYDHGGYAQTYGTYSGAPMNTQTGLEGSWRLQDGPIVNGNRPFGSSWSSWSNMDKNHRVRLEIQRIDLRMMGENAVPLRQGDEQYNIQLHVVNTFYIPVTFISTKETWLLRGTAQTTTGHDPDPHMHDMEQVLAYLIFSPDSVTVKRGHGPEQIEIKKGAIQALFSRPWNPNK